MRRASVVIAVLLLTSPALASGRPTSRTTAAAPRPFTLEHALTSRGITAPVWSHDGRRIAFVVSASDTAENTTNQDVWVYDVRTNAARALTRSPKNDYAPQFSPTGDTLAFLAARGTGDEVKPAVWFLPMQGGEPWPLGTFAESVGEIQWSPDGSMIAFTMLDTLSKQAREWRKKKWDHIVEGEIPQYNHLWVIDLASGKQRRLTSGAYMVAAPRWSPDSHNLAFTWNPTGAVDDGNLSDIAVVSATGGPILKLGALPDGDASWSPDSKWIAWAGTSDRKVFVEKTDLWVVRANGGKPSRLTAGFDEDARSPVWSVGSDSLFFTSAQGAASALVSVARTGGRVIVGPPQRHEILGPMVISQQGRAAWVQNSFDMPSELWIAEHMQAPGRRVTEVNASMRGLSLGDTRSIQWTSDDGTKVEGMLVRPPGAASGSALKTLVLLHGGPYTTRFGWGFQPMAQYMAAHGYQVFMPNFRSSGGYGTAFMVRKRADWGGQDWRDVQSGLDSLIERGLADPSKLGVFGHSYGGYLSAWAISQTTRFDAAVVSAGAVDLANLWGQSDTHQYRAFEFNGTPVQTFEQWRRASPLAYYQNVKTPTLVLNGELDQRVPNSQAQLDYQLLRSLGVPTQYVRYPREPHGIREPHHRADWFVRQLAWFDAYVR
ncbi:MAG: S9 family peptidase [Candidatus Eisenbacteria bacterium]